MNPTMPYDPTQELGNYQLPSITLLEDYRSDTETSDQEIDDNRQLIVKTFEGFGIPIQRIRATVGPTVTRYEIEQAPGVRISRISRLKGDIAQILGAESSIRLVAPMPGRGTIGIEVPNRNRQIVSMFSAVRSLQFQTSDAALPVAIGRTIENETCVFDLAEMPHLLIAGAVNQDKQLCLNAIITSLLYRKHPAQLKFVMIDTMMVELAPYAKLGHHFLAKMESEERAIVTDPAVAIYTLCALCAEMDRRFEMLCRAETRSIIEYNAKFTARQLNPAHGHRYLPYTVVVIDEFADLIRASKEAERLVMLLAQKGHIVGIHLIVATQYPEAKIITRGIKANFPARIALRMTQPNGSCTVIDRPDAEKLIGRGDMLFSKDGALTRVQCALVDTPEIERITNFIARQPGLLSGYALPDYPSDGCSSPKPSVSGNYDPLFAEVARWIVMTGQVSTSIIQRNFEVGFNRAGRIMLQLERAGIVSGMSGSNPREIYCHGMSELEAILQELGVL